MTRHYVGYDQIVGYETIVGQAISPTPGAAGMMRASVVPRGFYPMAAPVAPPPAPQAVQVPAGRAREQVLGLPRTSVASNATEEVLSRPEITFRPSRLLIGSNIADQFLINDIKVGNVSQLPNTDPIPALGYIETAVGTAMALDTCNIGQSISVDVTNVSACTLDFTGAFWGTALYPAL